MIHKEIISEKLFNLFESLNGRHFLFVEPGGNFGDSLIYKGAYKLAGLADLKYERMPFNVFMNTGLSSNQIVYIHGSGGFNPYWGGVSLKALIRAMAIHNGEIILGPSTFSEDLIFLERELVNKINFTVCRKAVFFAREYKSYKIMQRIFPKNVEVCLDHDTAFNLNHSDLCKKSDIRNRYTLYAVREDKEKTPDTKKIAKVYRGIWCDPILLCDHFNQWLDLHAKANIIVTNRTHSAVLGFVLGKKVKMFSNSYHKNRSIWEYSLQEKGVQWVDSLMINPFSHLVANCYPLKRFYESYKINRIKYRWLTR
ncbi:MAG: polysaccharide pyruvyl transferase family protein [Candidatus Omnitrophica bacterium]|nr:polysaccharide pyruvyl transferase family protein [Candidatus Omnitrophota bacterium]